MDMACDRSAQTFFGSVVGQWWAVRGSPVTYRSVVEVNLLVEMFRLIESDVSPRP